MITLYCHSSLETWSPESLKSGIGGSEQAVIYLTKALGKHQEVQVFNSVEKKKDNYTPYFDISSVTETDFLVVWRSPEHILDLKHIVRKKTVLWLHDLLKEIEILPYLYFYDTIVVGSLFHRNQYPNIPDNKIMIVPLGIDLSSINNVSNQERNPWKLCYFSAYDRGLRVLLEDWTKLKLQFPRLELVVGYGWETLDKLAKDRRAFDFFKGYMENLFDQVGVNHLGRVSQEEVLRHMTSSQLLAYPCIWPETSCLVAAQAQACGAVPVTTPLAALDETVQFGYKATTEPVWYEKVIEALTQPDDVEAIRLMMIPSTKKRLSWESIAETWQNSILTV